jgi:glycosyltransferase involved in cell wall biosynthesis
MTHSVVIPLFNKAEYITETLHSLMMQTKLPDELIIVDDASTDGSLLIAKDYLHQHTGSFRHCSIRVIELTENGGPGNARNIGVSHASGELISFLDADDLYHPHLLSVANHIFSTEELDLLVLGMKFIPGGESYPDTVALARYLQPVKENLYLLKEPLKTVTSPHFILGVGSNVITKSKWIRPVQYHVQSSLNEGIDFWYRVLKNIHTGKIGLLTGDLLSVREVKGSLSRKSYTHFREIVLPPVISRYKKSKDINDRLLMGMIGKRWYMHSLFSLQSARQRALFVLYHFLLLPQYVGYIILRRLSQNSNSTTHDILLVNGMRSVHVHDREHHHKRINN